MRPNLLKRDLRQQLFILFAGWSGKFGRSFGFNSSSAAKEQEPSELELTAVEAMSSVLCCGPCFNRQGLTEDSHSDVYSWLDILLASKNEKVRNKLKYLITNNLTYKIFLFLGVFASPRNGSATP